MLLEQIQAKIGEMEKTIAESKTDLGSRQESWYSQVKKGERAAERSDQIS